MTKKNTWSDRFETALHPAIAVFNASIGFDIELIEYDLTGSIAHAKMLAHTGIISDASLTTDIDCCQSCTHYRSQRCWNQNSPLYGFKVIPEGYCPVFEPEM